MAKTCTGVLKTAAHHDILVLGGRIDHHFKLEQERVFTAHSREAEATLREELERQKQMAIKESIYESEKRMQDWKDSMIAEHEVTFKLEVKKVKKREQDKARVRMEEQKRNLEERFEDRLQGSRCLWQKDKEKEIQDLKTFNQLSLEKNAEFLETKHQKELNEQQELYKEKEQAALEVLRGELLEENKITTAELEKESNARWNDKVADIELKAAIKLEEINQKLDTSKQANKELQSEVDQQKAELEHVKAELRRVMTSFENFVASCKGFDSYQSNFVLHGLTDIKLEQ